MASIVAFTDWLQAQSPQYQSSPQNIRYAGAAQTYAWSLLTRGKSFEQMLDGGTDIREKVMLTNEVNFANYGPNDVLTPTMPQVMSTAIAPWRFGSFNYSWTKNEELLNGGSSDFSDAARVMKYFDFMMKLETQFAYNAAAGVENTMFAVPDKTTMEDAGGLSPMSYFATFNDHADGLFNNITGTGTFTTRYQINPTSAGKKLFKRRLFGYTSAAITPAAGTKNMLGALDKSYIHLNFKKPYIPNTQADRNLESEGWNRKIALTSQTGCEKLMELLRLRNTNWYNASSELGLMGDLEYKGVEIFSVPALETAAVYHSDYGTPATLVTEGQSTTNVGPRIALLDTDAFKIVFHRERYFAREKPRTLDNQPFTNVVWGDVYYQFTAAYPHLCGLIAPGTVTGTFFGGNEVLTTTNGTVYGAY